MDVTILVIILVCEGILIFTSKILQNFFGSKNKTELELFFKNMKKDNNTMLRIYNEIKKHKIVLFSYYFFTGANTFYILVLLVGLFFPNTWIAVIGILGIFIYKIISTKEENIKFEKWDSAITLLFCLLNFLFLLWKDI